MTNDHNDSTFRSTLYEEILPYRTGHLTVDEKYGHELYWEEGGNPDGVPVVFIHGGPGAGASALSRRFFDPEFYRIIVYDQRGAGRSKPLGEIQNNTTPLLIEDLERLRIFLNIEKWLVFGGSWGSTLAIAYGIHHPQRCLGFVLRGIFLCRPSEIDWFLYGMKTFYPEYWRDFAHYVPAEQRDNLLEAYYSLLMDPDPTIHMPAAHSWSRYEGICATLLPSPETVDSFLDDTVALGLARMEAHYFRNHIFLPDNFLLDNIGALRAIPTYIVQGRYDILCPITTADEVAQALPEASYVIVPDAGHSAFDPKLCEELVRCCERFKEALRS